MGREACASGVCVPSRPDALSIASAIDAVQALLALKALQTQLPTFIASYTCGCVCGLPLTTARELPAGLHARLESGPEGTQAKATGLRSPTSQMTNRPSWPAVARYRPARGNTEHRGNTGIR
jgi:hypothetical protein